MEIGIRKSHLLICTRSTSTPRRELKEGAEGRTERRKAGRKEGRNRRKEGRQQEREEEPNDRSREGSQQMCLHFLCTNHRFSASWAQAAFVCRCLNIFMSTVDGCLAGVMSACLGMGPGLLSHLASKLPASC